MNKMLSLTVVLVVMATINTVFGNDPYDRMIQSGSNYYNGQT